VAAEHIVTSAREAIAQSLGASPEEIIFTSGGTEANNLAIRGVAALARGRHLITTTTEHSSVLAAFRALTEEGFELTELKVDRAGRVSAAQVHEALRPDTALVSVMAVNNEIGTIQPIDEIARVVHRRQAEGHRVLLHVDGVQAWGKIPLHLGRLGLDLVALSGHKVHGPKGIGVLYVRRGVRLAPLQRGGDQERQIRPGTENVAGIAGIGAAARLLSQDREETTSRLQRLRTRLLEQLQEVPDVQINSPREGVAPHILNAAFPGVRGETLLHRLEMDGVFLSTGSACHSHAPTPSHVLLAIGLPAEEASASLRFSLSRFTTAEEVDAAARAVRAAVPELRALVR
jgi:cysteine desulfurase